MQALDAGSTAGELTHSDERSNCNRKQIPQVQVVNGLPVSLCHHPWSPDTLPTESCGLQGSHFPAPLLSSSHSFLLFLSTVNSTVLLHYLSSQVPSASLLLRHSQLLTNPLKQ